MEKQMRREKTNVVTESLPGKFTLSMEAVTWSVSVCNVVSKQEKLITSPDNNDSVHVTWY